LTDHNKDISLTTDKKDEISDIIIEECSYLQSDNKGIKELDL